MNVTQPKLGSISAALSCLVRVPFPNSGWWSSLSQSQIRFLIGGELVKCQGSKLTNSPGWENLKNSLANQNLPAHDQVMHLETAARLCTSRRQTNHFFAVFFFDIWVHRYNKTFNDWSHGKQWVMFPFDSQCSRRLHLMSFLLYFSQTAGKFKPVFLPVMFANEVSYFLITSNFFFFVIWGRRNLRK